MKTGDPLIYTNDHPKFIDKTRRKNPLEQKELNFGYHILGLWFLECLGWALAPMKLV